MSRVLFRAISGTLVIHPSAARHPSQWEPACHLAVSGNAILKLPAPAPLSSHTEGVSAPNSALKTLITKHLGKLLKSFPIIFSLLIFQIFIHLYLFS